MILTIMTGPISILGPRLPYLSESGKEAVSPQNMTHSNHLSDVFPDITDFGTSPSGLKMSWIGLDLI